MGELYLIAVLDDVSQARLAALSDELTARGFEYTHLVPFHITLAGPDTPLDTMREHIESVCAATPAFDIGIGHVGLFGLAVLFLAPLPSEPLLTLERNLLGRINDAPDGWVPHVTMRMGEPEYIERAVPILARSFEPFTARIERVEMYETGEGYANFVRKFEFGR
ncbi:MAG: 2'-5' RNA ligase family protein [Oscillospiraceae bacterium]|nr:2'-5' RNA ligase family protein [Oscillospiraceae bacterium]